MMQVMKDLFVDALSVPENALNDTKNLHREVSSAGCLSFSRPE